MGEDPTGGKGENWQGTGTTTPVTSGGGDDYRSILGAQTAARQTQNADYQKEIEAARGQISGELGIPSITSQLQGTREEVSKVRDLIGKLEGDINQRTEGQLMSESQRRRLLAAEETPLRTQLASLVTSQDVATQQLALANQELDSRLAPLLSRIQSDQQLSADEWQMASDWAVQERQYQQDLEKMKQSAAITKANEPTYQEFVDLFKGSNIGTGASTGGEAKPTSKLGPVSAISPGSQWMWDFNSGDWIPIVD
jgi:hypothetical protein